MDGKLVIGLTGHFASGKSTLANLFVKEGYELIEVDHLGHQALLDCKDQVIQNFGKSIINDDGEIDRKTLGSIVFSDESKLKELEDIVHPQMILEVNKIIKESSSKKFILSAAILIEMKLYSYCNKVIVLAVDENILIERGKARNSLSEEEVRKRLKNQLALNIRKGFADYIINNNGSLEELTDEFRKIINSLEEVIL